jgi:hypothetical protein
VDFDYFVVHLYHSLIKTVKGLIIMENVADVKASRSRILDAPQCSSSIESGEDFISGIVHDIKRPGQWLNRGVHLVKGSYSKESGNDSNEMLI